MKKRQKEIHKIILLAISSFLLIHPALHEGHTISETAIFHSAPTIEHQHWDSLFFGARQGHHEGLLSNSFVWSFSLTDLIGSLSPQTLKSLIASQQSPILRC